MSSRAIATCLAAVAVLSTTVHAQASCARRSPTTTTEFYIEPAPVGARDTVVVARLCLSAEPKTIGSYMASLTYDSTKMRVVRVDVTGGMQATNSKTAGVIRIAGAAPAGFMSGPLAVLSFKPIAPRMLARLTLALGEASTVAGVSALAATRVTGWPVNPTAEKPARPPEIDSISPRSGEVSNEGVTDLILYGRGFAPSGNVVAFGGAEVRGLLSEAGGKIIRFAAPTIIPASGSVAAHRVTPGRVQVRVKHDGGTSNVVLFTVREER